MVDAITIALNTHLANALLMDIYKVLFQVAFLISVIKMHAKDISSIRRLKRSALLIATDKLGYISSGALLLIEKSNYQTCYKNRLYLELAKLLIGLSSKINNFINIKINEDL